MWTLAVRECFNSSKKGAHINHLRGNLRHSVILPKNVFGCFDAFYSWVTPLKTQEEQKLISRISICVLSEIN